MLSQPMSWYLRLTSPLCEVHLHGPSDAVTYINHLKQSWVYAYFFPDEVKKKKKKAALSL